MRIGLDFDNTIAGYDHVFAHAARAAGLVPAGFAGDKRAVRAALRALPDGETAWMRIQGQVYGKLMPEAALIDGVAAFLARARAAGTDVLIISHKTQYGHFDSDRVDLRQAARAWMQAQGFFAADGFALDPTAVFFETTREGKIARIRAAGLDAFVDDLEEVLAAPGFPEDVRRILFHPAGGAPSGPFTVHSRWDAIADDLLGPAG